MCKFYFSLICTSAFFSSILSAKYSKCYEAQWTCVQVVLTFSEQLQIDQSINQSGLQWYFSTQSFLKYMEICLMLLFGVTVAQQN